jgi:HAD superfamily hydrolase (TIGR01509 family)
MGSKVMLWDNDGVVVPTEEAIDVMNDRTLKGFGFEEFDPDQKAHWAGLPKRAGIEALLSHYSLLGEITVEDFMGVRAQQVYDWYSNEAQLIEGLAEFYRGIREAFPEDVAAVVSGTDPAEAYENMSARLGLRAMFDDNIFLSAKHPELPHKPHPAIYLYAMEQMGLPARFAIEDSSNGLASAIRAGIPKNIGFTRTLGEDGLRSNTERVLERSLGSGEVLFIAEYTPETLAEAIEYLR